MKSLMVSSIENDILEAFKHNRMTFITKEKPKKIFIDSGAANDEIIDYELVIHETSTKSDKEVSFRTSACIFPRVINLSDYDNVDLEIYEGNLFVHVR